MLSKLRIGNPKPNFSKFVSSRRVEIRICVRSLEFDSDSVRDSITLMNYKLVCCQPVFDFLLWWHRAPVPASHSYKMRSWYCFPRAGVVSPGAPGSQVDKSFFPNPDEKQIKLTTLCPASAKVSAILPLDIIWLLLLLTLRTNSFAESTIAI